jgi:sigma-B regulation protein RsbU (phosphoserine phosphatase)
LKNSLNQPEDAIAAPPADSPLRVLTSEVQSLTTELSQTIQTLEQITAIKKRMESELAVGRNIQMNLLTLTLPNFPKRKDLELDAVLQPARELGGDFYDFYFYREHTAYFFEQNTFCFCIGDVSGKGVPASLFMAVVKTLLRTQADITLSPSKILTQVNQALSVDNPDCMFATLCFFTLNLTTGALVYTNAGHNPPYIRRQDGALELLERSHGLPIGVLEDVTYREGHTTLNYGDLLFSYTDGVTEAMDAHGNLFSDERLFSLMQSDRYSSAKEVIQLVCRAVAEFQGDADQSDDITMLALQFLGHPEAIEKRSELTIKDEVLSSLREAWQ